MGRALVEPEDDLGVQDLDDRLHIAVPHGSHERVHRLPLPDRVGLDLVGRLSDAAAPTARQLASGGRGPVHDRRDLLERHREDVVQDERHPLRRRQLFEHALQSQPHRLADQRLLLRIAGGPDYQRIGETLAQSLLAAGAPLPESVEADASHHRAQPGAQVRDLAGRRSRQPEPGLLHRILGLGYRPQHPVGDAQQ